MLEFYLFPVIRNHVPVETTCDEIVYFGILAQLGERGLFFEHYRLRFFPAEIFHRFQSLVASDCDVLAFDIRQRVNDQLTELGHFRVVRE